MTVSFDVVVVDDADDVRSLLKQQLRLSGRFTVVGEGSTGRHAVELAARHKPALLVLDASMPDMDGLSAIPGILSASPTTRIVMFSGFDAGSLRADALARGAVDYIEKSTSIKDIPGRLLSALGDDLPPMPPVGDSALDAQAEAVLAEHLERFRTVFDQAAIGMATLTLSGTVVRANEALIELLAIPETEIVGRPIETFSAEEGRAAVLVALRSAVQDSGAQEIEHRLVGQNTRWAHTTIAAVRDTAGRPLYMFAQLEDITTQHDALEQLRVSEERFRLMVELVQDYAIFMLDRDGLVTTWNLGAKRLNGYDAEEIIGRHFATFYPQDARSRNHPATELEIAHRDGRYEEEGWRVRKDGTEFWANVVITALFDSKDEHLGFAKVTRDMTERRRVERELAASNKHLHLAAQQTEEFLTIIAHELQSPVATISSAAEILIDYWDRLDATERLETVERIAAGGERIRRLLDDLLTASRLDAGTFTVTPERVSVSEIVDRTLRELEDASADVETAGTGDLYINADPVRVVQILTNLVSNALKYGAPPVSIEARAMGAFIELRVQDQGEGVEPELQERLFDKFAKTLTNKVRGTGLGLYIVRELARRQGGDAWYENEAAFVVSLPKAHAVTFE